MAGANSPERERPAEREPRRTTAAGPVRDEHRAEQQHRPGEDPDELERQPEPHQRREERRGARPVPQPAHVVGGPPHRVAAVQQPLGGGEQRDLVVDRLPPGWLSRQTTRCSPSSGSSHHVVSRGRHGHTMAATLVAREVP
jgi:hypothetical protein